MWGGVGVCVWLGVSDPLPLWVCGAFFPRCAALWYHRIPGEADSSIVPGFYPEAKCQLGAPKGKGARVGSTWTYTREFEHASVFVDLTNRTASHVTFLGMC
mmetsp:Transcript_13815/g.35502  ORF Transcript_13815/g.35502 Transcript_13815/m.35502 type:complete len:101 (+) Transcript_13815:729-1031(+)